MTNITPMQDNTMYLEQIQIQNYGPIKDIDYKLPFNEDGTPKSVVLIGKNGSGKTLLLANVIHSLIEFKKHNYTVLNEVDKNMYYRYGKTSYIKTEENFSYINYNYSCNYRFTDLATNNINVFRSNFPTLNLQNIDINDKLLNKDRFFHNYNNPPKEVFENNIFFVFPS